MHVINSRSHRLYAGMFVLLVLLWPLFLSSLLSGMGHFGPWVLGALILLNAAVYITVVKYTSGKNMSLWKGLCALASSFESGCANITVLYIPFVLAYYYIGAVHATYTGIRKRDREWTVRRWAKTVIGRFDTEQEYLAHSEPPKWFS